MGAKAAFFLPRGLESWIDGAIDLVEMNWKVFDPATLGRGVEPEEMRAEAEAARNLLVETADDGVDWPAELYLDGMPAGR